jgi:hypothetical protein
MLNLFQHLTGQADMSDHYANGIPKQVRDDVRK